MFGFVSKSNPVKDIYCVGVAVDGTAYMYPCFSLSYLEALKQALMQHEEAGLPLPAGTNRCVYGSHIAGWVSRQA